ncbi:MAG: box helicase domain protein [Betaproteobacteria bacterium]|nr:box helicase domain protein [Betaproteobacteria bacterium]
MIASEELAHSPIAAILADNDSIDTSADAVSSPVSVAISAFGALGLNAQIVKAVADAGYDNPTPVQSATIPVAITRRDVIVSSQTGSGKTAAFMLPALEMLGAPPKVKSYGPRMLVLAPTRELALQVTRAAETYGKYMRRVRVVSILGGMPYPVQNRLLKSPVDILVATPGRLLDHMRSGRIDFSRLEMLVLDEADRMLDMGFIEDIETVVAATPASRQTMLFSATLDGTIGQLARKLTRDPQRIEVSSAQSKHDNIEQRLHYTDDQRHKMKLVDHYLRGTDVDQAIVFTSTKRAADELADALVSQGFPAAALHGDMNQGQRNRTLGNMRRGNVKVLVATDVAARGIDVPTISHVINFDLPRMAEDYVHRIGRTGRAGRNGIAISLAGLRDHGQVKQIERFTTQPIKVHVVPGLEPKILPSNRPKPSHGRGGYSKPGTGRPAAGGYKAGGGYKSGAPHKAGAGTGGGFKSGAYAGKRNTTDR